MSHSNVRIRLHNNQSDYDTTHMKKAADLVWEQKWLLCATNNCLPQLFEEKREPLWQCFCSFPTVQLSKPDSNSLIWHSGCHITWKHCVVWDWHNISKSDNLPNYGVTVSTATSGSRYSWAYLSSSAFIWKASSNQSSSLWVNSLTSCCWAKHR